MFKNRIRLPIELKSPQYTQSQNAFRKADGTTKIISSSLTKKYEGATDYMPEKWHERLIVALTHDVVNIESDRYLGKIVIDGDYDIGWLAFLGYPTAPATFKATVTPFNVTNSNCQTCEEAIQVDLIDDKFPEALDEEGVYIIDVRANDNICCYPATFSISGLFNAEFLSSASIDQNGIVSVTLKDNLPMMNNVLLLTYRVACPNGGYDEAGVYADINGSVEVCLAPTDLEFTGVTTSAAVATWTQPDPIPVIGYIWDLFKTSEPGVAVQTGDYSTDSVVLTGLEPGTEYTFYIRSACAEGFSSHEIGNFTTAPLISECGNYEVSYALQPSNNPSIIEITYVSCNGNTITEYMVPSVTTVTTICALQRSPGVPISILFNFISETGIATQSRMFIDYIDLC